MLMLVAAAADQTVPEPLNITAVLLVSTLAADPEAAIKVGTVI
jgi:hypothetical protein